MKRYIVLRRKVSKYPTVGRPQGYRMTVEELSAPDDIPDYTDETKINFPSEGVPLGESAERNLVYIPEHSGELSLLLPDGFIETYPCTFSVVEGEPQDIPIIFTPETVRDYSSKIITHLEPTNPDIPPVMGEVGLVAHGTNDPMCLFVHSHRANGFIMETVASPVDMEEYPKWERDEGDTLEQTIAKFEAAVADGTLVPIPPDHPHVRLPFFDVYTRSPYYIGAMWEAIVSDCQELLRTLRVTDRIEAEDPVIVTMVSSGG